MTGATGFLGSHLTHALLEAGCAVTVLARSSGTRTARDRALDALGRIAPHPSDARPAFDGLEVVEGDIGAPRAGLDAATWRRLADSVDEVWHAAASLSFMEARRSEIFRMNVDGVRQIIALAERTRGRRLHHVSTAYVAGRRTDLCRESELDMGQEFRNPYEESKCRAEELIREAHSSGRIAASVYRPSVVIGESATGRATHLHGVYAFIRGMWTLAERMRGKTGREVVDLALRVRGRGDATLNFVPIDYVTRAMLRIGSLPSSVGATYHLTNPEPTPNSQWLGVICDQLGVRGVRLVPRAAFAKRPMTRMEDLFHRKMAFYSRYLEGEPQFDRTRALTGLDGTGIACPRVTASFNRRMTSWYVDRLRAESEPVEGGRDSPKNGRTAIIQLRE